MDIFACSVHMGCAMEYDSTTSAATTQRSANWATHTWWWIQESDLFYWGQNPVRYHYTNSPGDSTQTRTGNPSGNVPHLQCGALPIWLCCHINFGIFIPWWTIWDSNSSVVLSARQVATPSSPIAHTKRKSASEISCFLCNASHRRINNYLIRGIWQP